ncbi:MAG: YciI family protein [Bacteroidota bacterium]
MPQYLVLTTDHCDDEALNRRLAVRKKHLQRMKVEKAAGRFIIGGAKLNAAGQMCGSMLLVILPSEEAAKEWVSLDPYITGKVWEHIEILPFKVADV